MRPKVLIFNIHQVVSKLLREAVGEQRAIANVRHDPALVWTGILEYLLTQKDVEIEALRIDECHSVIRPVHVAQTSRTARDLHVGLKTSKPEPLLIHVETSARA
jgi:hypothetical protein